MSRSEHPQPQSWRWSDLSYDMRVLTWWMRGNGDVHPTKRPHPWWKVYLAVAFAFAVLFGALVLLAGFSIDDLRSSFSGH